jgi:uncharacterized protein YjbI with pentapeptide repeats
MARLGTFRVALLAALVAILTPTQAARADIFQWEYVNPANPNLGKQRSATLAPDGAGVNTGQGVDLSSRNLAKAYLIGADLSAFAFYDGDSYYYYPTDLTGANLSQADLTFANLDSAMLLGANLTNSEVRGARLCYSGITVAQLTSTASYQAHDLFGIDLAGNQLIGINLASQNLGDANFSGTVLTSANFSQSNLSGASLSYAAMSGADFSQANLTGVFFVAADLTNANFTGANLTNGSIGDMISGANFSNAVIRGATVWGLSKAQIYSTASYQAGDLTGIYFYSSQTNWNFAGKNLTGAQFQSAVDMSNSSFAGADLTDAYLSYVSFQNANFSNADLTGADLSYGKLTGANFTGADVRGAKLSREFTHPGSGISISQLVSTASYQAHDLSGIRLRGNVLTNANLANQNLTDADFAGAALDGANLTGAEVRGAQFHLHPSGQSGGLTPAQLQSTASYQAHDLSGIGLGGNNLAGANLVGQNLTNADFESAPYGANLNGANLSHANLTQARFGKSTLTGATLVQTNLANLNLQLTELSNANLREANVSNSNFAGWFIVVPGEEGGYYHFPGTNLAGANLTSANLANANFAGTEDYVFGFPHPGANLTNANLSGADARGASFQYATMTGAITANLIQSNGHIAGLDLTAGKSLLVRDYELFIGDDVPIVVDEHLTMGATGSLALMLDADPWGSTISFAPGISVALGGTLQLTFAPDVNIATQSGRTIDLFDWTGVTPTGAFTVESPYAWNLSKLYTTGEITLTTLSTLAGDFNGNGVVDAADYTVWRDGLGSTYTPADYAVWKAHFGESLGSGSAGAAPSHAAAPEPATFVLIVVPMLGLSVCRWRRHQ